MFICTYVHTFICLDGEKQKNEFLVANKFSTEYKINNNSHAKRQRPRNRLIAGAFFVHLTPVPTPRRKVLRFGLRSQSTNLRIFPSYLHARTA